MKTNTQIASTFILGAFLLIGCQEKVDTRNIQHKVALEQQQITNDSLELVYKQTLKDIDKNLAQITLRHDIVYLNSEDQSEMSVSEKDRIVNNIKVINSLMEDNKLKIQSLENAIRKSKNNTAEWKDKVFALEMMIDEHVTTIDELKNQLAQNEFLFTDLNAKYDSLGLRNQLLSDSLMASKDKLNEAYFAIGSFKELKESGILEKEGGFIGIGRNKVLTDSFDTDYFSAIDIRELKRIPLFSKKAELITDHPKDTYSFSESDDMIAYLEIEDPEEFWKASKYMVVEVKK